MNIQKTEIVGINYSDRAIIYELNSNNDNYYFSTLPYSKDANFMSNNYGATKELRIGKTLYIALNDNKEIIAISDGNEICILDLIVNQLGEYKRNDIPNKKEYANIVKYEIENDVRLVR